ncbi:rhodanese-like domain-containing protein [Paracoccaceae bacterium]
MFNQFGTAQPRLTAADAVAGLAKGDLTVIDCREANELRASGTAQGGLHVPLALLALKADPSGPDHDKRLDPTRPVAVFCASGGRSGMAVQVLQRLGYSAHNIGGFGDWCAAGGPVKR